MRLRRRTPERFVPVAIHYHGQGTEVDRDIERMQPVFDVPIIQVPDSYAPWPTPQHARRMETIWKSER